LSLESSYVLDYNANIKIGKNRTLILNRINLLYTKIFKFIPDPDPISSLIFYTAQGNLNQAPAITPELLFVRLNFTSALCFTLSSISNINAIVEIVVPEPIPAGHAVALIRSFCPRCIFFTFPIVGPIWALDAFEPITLFQVG